jgi:hypothetical protein
MSHKVFADPEFLRQLHIIPFDTEADLEAERRREYEASYVFARNQEREEGVGICRAILGGIGFTVVCGGLLYLGWCLIAHWRML